MYFTKKMKLEELLANEQLIIGLCNNAKGFKLSWDIANQVINPINGIIKHYNEKNNELVKQYGTVKQGETNPSISRQTEPEQFEKYRIELEDILREEFDINLYKFTEETLVGDIKIIDKPITASHIAYYIDLGML